MSANGMRSCGLGVMLFCLSSCLFLVARHKMGQEDQSVVPAAATAVESGEMPVLRPPPCLHKELRKPELKDNVIIVGDIHGCLDEFKALLAKCNYDARLHSVVLVGDMVNKGPFSAEVVKFCRQIGAHSVRGNHDEAALRARCRRADGCSVGCSTPGVSAKYQYTLQWTPADAEWLMDLPYVLILPEFGAAVVHAGLAPGVALDAQLPYHMTCMRNLRPAAPGANNAVGGYEVFETAAPGAESWAPLWSLEDAEGILHGCHLYFGHDAARRLQRCEHATGLDTGCCYGKQLSAVVLPGGALVQVDALRQYVKPASD